MPNQIFLLSKKKKLIKVVWLVCVASRYKRAFLNFWYLFSLVPSNTHRVLKRSKRRNKRTFANINIFSLIKQDGWKLRERRENNIKDKEGKKAFISGFFLLRSKWLQLKAKRRRKSKHYIGLCWHKNAAWILNEIKFPFADEFLKKLLLCLNTNTNSRCGRREQKVIGSNTNAQKPTWLPSNFFMHQKMKIIFRFPETLNV